MKQFQITHHVPIDIADAYWLLALIMADLDEPNRTKTFYEKRDRLMKRLLEIVATDK